MVSPKFIGFISWLANESNFLSPGLRVFLFISVRPLVVVGCTWFSIHDFHSWALWYTTPSYATSKETLLVFYIFCLFLILTILLTSLTHHKSKWLYYYTSHLSIFAEKLMKNTNMFIIAIGLMWNQMFSEWLNKHLNILTWISQYKQY